MQTTVLEVKSLYTFYITVIFHNSYEQIIKQRVWKSV